jgi:hypothetical protein
VVCAWAGAWQWRDASIREQADTDSRTTARDGVRGCLIQTLMFSDSFLTDPELTGIGG